jgi:hypothetical protein
MANLGIVKGTTSSNKTLYEHNKKKDVAVNPMKFSNGDVSLDEAIKANNGHLEWANTGILKDTSW